MKSSNISGIVLEGIAGTGKTTVIKLLQNHSSWLNRVNLSSIVLSEHQTLRVLEQARDLNNYSADRSVDLLTSHVEYLETLKIRLDKTDWLQRDREAQKVAFILERFHLSHVYHYEQLVWEDVAQIDQRLMELKAQLFLLTIDEQDIQSRIIDDYKKANWSDYLATLGSNDDEICEHFINKQNELIEISKSSHLPVKVINTSKLSPEALCDHILSESRLA